MVIFQPNQQILKIAISQPDRIGSFATGRYCNM